MRLGSMPGYRFAMARKVAMWVFADVAWMPYRLIPEGIFPPIGHANEHDSTERFNRYRAVIQVQRQCCPGV